jgi:hypothetical protein
MWSIGVAVLASMLVPAAFAAAPVTVSGTQTIVNEQLGQFEMHGSLIGKWNVTAWAPHYQTASRIAATGKERFTGCLDTNRSRACDAGEPAGTMRFTFVYWATFNPATKALVRGACVHPVLGGTGDFAKAKGVILMNDRPTAKGVRTTYSGTLEYGAVAARTSQSRSLASRLQATCGG